MTRLLVLENLSVELTASKTKDGTLLGTHLVSFLEGEEAPSFTF